MVIIRWSGRSRSCLETTLVVLGLLGTAFLGVAVPAMAAYTPGPAVGPSDTFVLRGDAGAGWGNGTESMSNPGPILYVYQGQNVSIRLYAADNMDHNWYVDLNGNGKDDTGDLSSLTFSSSSTALVFNFTVPTDRIGPYTYRCRFHPITMTGQIVILTPPVVRLYGSQTKGWSFESNKSTAGPGPTLYVLYGTNLTLHLVSTDGPLVPHTWFVDYDNDTASTGDPISATFNATKPTTYVYTPDRSGTFEYRCSFHPIAMTGVILVAGNAAAPPRGLQITLIPAIMIATIVVILILAGVYQVRAVRAARRIK